MRRSSSLTITMLQIRARQLVDLSSHYKRAGWSTCLSTPSKPRKSLSNHYYHSYSSFVVVCFLLEN